MESVPIQNVIDGKLLCVPIIILVIRTSRCFRAIEMVINYW